MLKKSSSQDPLLNIGHYLSRNIPRTRRFKCVKIKSLRKKWQRP